jgi:hypothetical protein
LVHAACYREIGQVKAVRAKALVGSRGQLLSMSLALENEICGIPGRLAGSCLRDGGLFGRERSFRTSDTRLDNEPKSAGLKGLS